MNYLNIYNKIISNAKLENRKKGINYYENHHILPKCMNGLNDENNLVLLTAREHFICHKLLTFIYPKNKKLYYAFNILVNGNKEKRNLKLSSKDYEYAKKLIHLAKINIKMKDKTKQLISKSLSGKNNPMYGLKGKLHPAFGNKLSKEQRNKLSNSLKGKKFSDEHKNNLSNSCILKYKNNINLKEKLSKYAKERIGIKNGMFNKKHNELTKEKMKIAWLKKKEKGFINNKNRQFSDETKQKMSLKKKGIKHTPEWKINHAEKMKLYHKNKNNK